MKKTEINAFIDEMEEIGDIWTPEEVEDVYGESTLSDALSDRKLLLGQFFNNIEKILNK